MHRTAIERLSHAGGVPSTALAIVCELFRDWAGPLADAGREVTATLATHVSPKVTILGFAIAVSVGIAASALKLARGPNPQAPAPGWR